jgi:hypothetical protein
MPSEGIHGMVQLASAELWGDLQQLGGQSSFEKMRLSVVKLKIDGGKWSGAKKTRRL